MWVSGHDAMTKVSTLKVKECLAIACRNCQVRVWTHNVLLKPFHGKLLLAHPIDVRVNVKESEIEPGQCQRYSTSCLDYLELQLCDRLPIYEEDSKFTPVSISGGKFRGGIVLCTLNNKVKVYPMMVTKFRKDHAMHATVGTQSTQIVLCQGCLPKIELNVSFTGTRSRRA